MEDHTKLNDFEVQNQIENRKQRLTIIGAVAVGLLIIIGFFWYIESDFSISSAFNSGDAKKYAVQAARNKGYAVYEDTVKVEESDKYERYFITMNARVASLDNIKLVCYIELLDYEYVFIVCPDTFENAWERTEWKNNVKASNGWGSSAK